MRSPFKLRRMVPPALQPTARAIYYRVFRLCTCESDCGVQTVSGRRCRKVPCRRRCFVFASAKPSRRVNSSGLVSAARTLSGNLSMTWAVILGVVIECWILDAAAAGRSGGFFKRRVMPSFMEWMSTRTRWIGAAIILVEGIFSRQPRRRRYRIPTVILTSSTASRSSHT